MHLFGKQIWVEIFRGGELLTDFAVLLYYDFNSQKFVPLNFTTEPGDLFRIHCVWNTLDSNVSITGGETTQNEMCLFPVLYYPKAGSFASCTPSGTPCQCSYDGIPQFCNSTGCLNGTSTATSSCLAVKDCATCIAQSGCGWCPNNLVTGCFPTSIGSLCPSGWNNCTLNGTSCGPNYASCASCSASKNPSCAWCYAGTFGANSLCIADPSTAQANAACSKLTGTIDWNCTFNG